MSGQTAGQPFPLHWPEGWPRSKSRARSAYKPTGGAFVTDRVKLGRRLEAMGGKTIVISSNIPLRKDGMPMASGGRSALADPGVAVYFMRAGRSMVVASDRWLTVEENLRAILRTIEALAVIERSGSAQLQDRAFAGFAMLPADTFSWRAELGIGPALVLTRECVEDHYRARARTLHPDAGGNEAAMARLNRARVEALAAIDRRDS